MVIHDEKLRKMLIYKGNALRRNSSLVKMKICKKVAEEYNLPLDTVRYYMFSQNARGRYKEKYDKRYDLKYKKLIRHIDSFLPQVFNGNSELQLGQISNGINDLTGISLKEGTLERLLLRYENKPKGSPLAKTEAGNYRLNELFYKN